MRSIKSYSSDFLGASHAYSVTRVKVMKTLLFKKDDYDKMLKMSVPEISRVLQENQYKKEIDELASDYSGLVLTQMALTKNLENTFQKILGFSIQTSKEQIRLFLKKYDISNIMTVLKGFNAGINRKELKDNLLTAGSLKRPFFEKIINESSSFEDAVNGFKGTHYHKMITEFKDDLASLEDHLFKRYYEELLSAGDADLKDYAFKKIKAFNSRQIIRKERHKGLRNIVIARIKKSYFIPDSFKGKEEAFLLKQVLAENLKKIHLSKSTIGVLIAFFIAKEIEAHNLRFIAVGKNAGLPEEQIRENLVIA